jgi:hypothetical protein
MEWPFGTDAKWIDEIAVACRPDVETSGQALLSPDHLRFVASAGYARRLSVASYDDAAA